MGWRAFDDGRRSERAAVLLETIAVERASRGECPLCEPLINEPGSYTAQDLLLSLGAGHRQLQPSQGLRQERGWTQGQVADLIGLSDTQAINEIERGDRKMTNARWTVMLLAANRRPTLKLTRQHGAAPEPTVS